MQIIKAIILGIIEGITEFLPISSTSHLIITNQIINFDSEFAKTFDVFIQLGAILAVITIYFKTLNPIKKNNKKEIILLSKIIISCIPISIFGLMFSEEIMNNFNNNLQIALALIIGGIFLFIIKEKKINFTSVHQITYMFAFLVGLFQVLALIPGTSRALACILGAIILKADKKTATEYSFLIAVPTIMAASLYSLYQYDFNFTRHQIILLFIGSFTAFAIALFVVKVLLDFIKSQDFKLFGYYRIILGCIILFLMR